jgi:MFS family permease
MAGSVAHQRRNFFALVGDFVLFGTGMSFTSQTTVLPAFIAGFTSSDPLIGLSSTLSMGGWLLPQLFAANTIAGKTRKKAAVTIPAAFSRGCFLAMGPVVLLLAPRSAGLALGAFFALYFFAFALDGIASVPWLDILGKSLTPRLRSRLVGFGQVGGGIGGIAAGVAVGIILSSGSLAFPLNYAALLILSGILYTISLVCFLFLHEEPEPTGQKPLPWSDYFRRLPATLKADRRFRGVIAVQLLIGTSGVATPFYVIHGLGGLGFAQASIGIFTSAQVAGSIMSALIMAYIGEKRGTRSVIRLWSVLTACTSLLALSISLGRSLAPTTVLMYAYSLVFVLVGWQGNAGMAGFMNYVLEIAPAANRPMYIGFANTLNALNLVMPLLGGWLLAATSSYAALFICATAGPLAGILLSTKLAEPRHDAGSRGIVS